MIIVYVEVAIHTDQTISIAIGIITVSAITITSVISESIVGSLHSTSNHVTSTSIRKVIADNENDALKRYQSRCKYR